MKEFRVLLLMCLIIIIALLSINKNSKTILQNQKNNNIKTNMLSIMVETSDGVYETSSDSSWPSSGYTFNKNLSKCENGGKLTWDNTTNTVKMVGETSDKCYVYFDTLAYESISKACTSKELGTCIANNYQGDSAIYYHDPNSSEGAQDGSYRYMGGDFTLTSKAINAGYLYLMDSTTSSSDGVINLYYGSSKSTLGSLLNKTLNYYYTLAYDANNTQYSTYNSALNKAISDGYLTKNNVKNFVCLGSNSSTCPTDNLYRIIGVFNNQLKLVKYDAASSDLLGTNGDYKSTVTTHWHSADRGSDPGTSYSYYYNYNYSKPTDGSNDWPTSLLNKTNLNTKYYSSISFSNLISSFVYNVSGYSKNSLTAKAMYDEEIKNATLTSSINIGLMYASDYGFAADKSNWNLPLSNYNEACVKSSNWLFAGKATWTITPVNDDNYAVFAISSTGALVINDSINAKAIYPVFYLKSTVKLDSGEGTIENPYQLVA